MNLYFAAVVAACIAFCGGGVWFGVAFRAPWRTAHHWDPLERPGVLAKMFLATFLAACVLGLVGRWTFAFSFLDGAFLGLVLWVLVLAVGWGGDLFWSPGSGASRRLARVQWGYWLWALPLMGGLVVRLTRLPSLLGVLGGP